MSSDWSTNIYCEGADAVIACALYRDIKIIYHGIRALWVLEAITVVTTAIVTKIGEGVCDVNFAPAGASKYALP